jgi:hypothetical protein
LHLILGLTGLAVFAASAPARGPASRGGVAPA